MFDLKINLIKSLVAFLSLMFIGVSILLALIGETAVISLFVPILLGLLSIIGMILTFVPFFKNHIWLIIPVDIAVGALVAVILHFVC
jgi:hypothetical protein